MTSTAIRGESELSTTEKELLQFIRTLHFGSVEVQVHEKRIVQIERRERRRFDDPKSR